MLNIYVTEHQRIGSDYEKGIISRFEVKKELKVLIEKCEKYMYEPNISPATHVDFKDLIDLCEQNIKNMDGDTKEIESATGPATTP